MRSSRKSLGGMKLPRSSPKRASCASHSESPTSVLRPGTFLTWKALTTGLDHEDFGEPVDVPARDFSAELEAFGSGRLGWPPAGLEGEVGRVAEWRGGAQLIEGELAHERHVLCSVALAHAREVLLEGHVERPVQRVLDAPVAADCLGEPGGGENAGSNVISRVEPGAIL